MIPLGIYTYLTGVSQTVSGFDRIRNSMYQLRGIITQASITTYVFAMLMRRSSQTARRLQTVQENVGQTIRRYGRYSLEATQAMRRLEQAQENAKFAQIEFAMQAIYSAGSILTLMFRIGEYIASLKILEATLWGVSVAKIAAFGVVAAAGVIGGIAIGSIFLGGRGGGEEASFDRQWAEAGRYVKDEWYRQRR